MENKKYHIYLTAHKNKQHNLEFNSIQEALECDLIKDRINQWENRLPSHDWVITDQEGNTVMSHETYEWHFVKQGLIKLNEKDPFLLVSFARSLQLRPSASLRSSMYGIAATYIFEDDLIQYENDMNYNVITYLMKTENKEFIGERIFWNIAQWNVFFHKRDGNRAIMEKAIHWAGKQLRAEDAAMEDEDV